MFTSYNTGFANRRMRTYTRKPPEFELIENVLELCRLCLHKLNQPVPIFEGDDNKHTEALPMRIMICLGLEITNDQSLPKMICSQCFKDLNHYYDFKKKCLSSYQRLKSHCMAVTQRTNLNNLKLNNGLNNKFISQELVEENKINGVHNQNVISTNNENVFEYINVNDERIVGINQGSEKEQIENVPTYIVNNNLEFLNSTTQPPIPPIPEDVSSFLTTILVQLGVLTKDKDRIAIVNQTFSNVRLETTDGSVTLELVEEDQDDEVEEPEKEIVQNNKVKFIYDANKGIQTNKAVCGTCGKRFSCRSALVRHARGHSGARPHACDVCGKTFTQKEVLKRHKNLHKPEPAFKCGVCGAGFSQRALLRAHSRSHAPDRSLRVYKCTRCPKIFLHASGLSRHQATHSGLVFECAVCQRPFNDKSSLARHRRNLHHYH